MESEPDGCRAAGGFACGGPLLRPAEERESRDRSSFLSRLDPRPPGRCGGCGAGFDVGTEGRAGPLEGFGGPAPALGWWASLFWLSPSGCFVALFPFAGE